MEQHFEIEELEDLVAPGFWSSFKDGLLTGLAVGGGIAAGVGIGVAIAT